MHVQYLSVDEAQGALQVDVLKDLVTCTHITS